MDILITKQKNKNILHELGNICSTIQQKVPNLFVQERKEQSILSKEEISDWAFQTVTTILDYLKTSDLKHYFRNVKHPFPNPNMATLIPKEQTDASVMVEVILWSCISKACNCSIVTSLKGIDEKFTIPQKHTPPTDNCLMNWLHGMSYSIKGAVYCFSGDVNKQYLYIEEFIKNTAKLFSIIGKNGLPLKSVMQEPSHQSIIESLLSKSNLDKDNKIGLNMPALATFTYIYYLETGHDHCDILSFMLRFKEIKEKHTLLLAINSISTLYEDSKMVPVDNSISHLLTMLHELVYVEFKTPISVETMLELGKDKMIQLFGETAETGSTPSVKKFMAMSLSLTSLTKLNEDGHTVLHNCFVDALKGCTTPIDQATKKQLITHLSRQLSKTVLSDDKFIETYLNRCATERNVTKKDMDLLWKTHFVDMLKLGKLKKILPDLKKESHDKITQEWLNKNPEAQSLDKGVDKTYTKLRYVVLNLCVTHIHKKQQEAFKPIRMMPNSQQIICQCLNDALHEGYYAKESNTSSMIAFLGGVMNHLSKTLFKDNYFLISFIERYAINDNTFPENDSLWSRIWDNIKNKNNEKGVPTNKRKHVAQEDSKPHNKKQKESKSHKKKPKEITQGKELKSGYDILFCENKSSTKSSATSKVRATTNEHKVTRSQTTPKKRKVLKRSVKK